MHILRYSSRLLAQASIWLALLATAIMIGSLLLGVFFRYVVQSSLSWSDEMAILAFTWVVFLVSSLCVREDSHVRITLIDDLLPAKLHWALTQLILLTIAAFGIVMVWTGYDFVGYTLGQVSPALRYPSWLMNSAVVVSGALITVHALARLAGPTAAPGGEHE